MKRLIDDFIAESGDLGQEGQKEAMDLLIELEQALYNINHRFCR